MSVIATLALLFMNFFQPLYTTQGVDSAQFQPTKMDSMPTVIDAKLQVETVAEGLNFPSSMAFLGPDDILVTEKNNGTVQRIINGTIQPSPVLDIQRCH